MVISIVEQGRFGVAVQMKAEDQPVPHVADGPVRAIDSRDELARRVLSSSTFEKSPRLKAFLEYVCRCALDNHPEECAEQQIGIYVFGRTPGYNTTEDNIVRSHARLLRLKLEHHFNHEGKDESVVITIPKGRYLPAFERRFEQSGTPAEELAVNSEIKRRDRLLVVSIVMFGLTIVLAASLLYRSKVPSSTSSAGGTPRHGAEVNQPAPDRQLDAPIAGEIRIAAGHTGAPYVDVWGHRWEADRYYQGGVLQAGPRHFFPPVADEGMFRSMREAASTSIMVPQTQREFHYDIPASPGVYELRLYFADPLRQPDVENKEDAQNSRHFQINLNGHPLLVEFDPIADAGSAAVDVRAFKDVSPAADGKLHLEFVTGWGAPPFVSAVELTPGSPGKLKPIRISAHRRDFVDADGTRWSGDNYFIEGRTNVYENPESGPKIAALYTAERHGNFNYAIPVAPGSYTVKLHFLESFFTPLIPAAFCQGAGCRVFDVSCNGVMLLQDFDIVQAAPGALRPVVREFHGLHPNGQGKLLLSFSPRVNYAEVRAIEVTDEAP